MTRAWTLTHDRDAILEALERAQVPCGPIYGIDEIFEDAQYASRGNLLTVSDSRIGELTIPNVVPRLSETPGYVSTLGPPLGANTDEILERIGIGTEERAELKSKGVT
jgi:succinyl-CoA:(S)-malate CoA-transferase subunit B